MKIHMHTSKKVTGIRNSSGGVGSGMSGGDGCGVGSHGCGCCGSIGHRHHHCGVIDGGEGDYADGDENVDKLLFFKIAISDFKYFLLNLGYLS